MNIPVTLAIALRD